MQLSKRQAKASTLASYYEKLALIFWKAGNVLYHAAALMKLLQLTKELKKTVSHDEFTQYFFDFFNKLFFDFFLKT